MQHPEPAPNQVLPHFNPIASNNEPKNYAARDAVIETIYQKISEKIREFMTFDYLIVVPPKNSLYEQTKRRLMDDLHVNEAVANQKVLKINSGTETNEFWEKFYRKCNKLVPFLILTFM